MWALGCMLFEMVCGRPPFDGDPIAIHADAIAGRRPAVRELAPGLHEAVVNAIDGALLPVATRFPDPKSMLSVLDGAPYAPGSSATVEFYLPSVDRFVLGTRLGQRHGATTWTAIDTATGAAVIARTAPLVGDPKALEREARALGQLTHPRIPRLIAHVEAHDGERQVLVVARAEVTGATLAQAVAERRLDRTEALGRVREVLGLLGYLHSLAPPIVVRDVAAERFVVHDGAVWLVELGAVSDQPSGPLGGTTFAGTFGYAAPETYASDASPANDVWGAGGRGRGRGHGGGTDLRVVGRRLVAPNSLGGARAGCGR